MNFASIKRYCAGSATLAWLTLGEAAVWLTVTILSLAGKMMHSDMHLYIAEWTTLPSAFSLFLSRPWTLITYMAVHFDFLHMAFNVLWLYWFGSILLRARADRHLLLTFIGGGICGGLVFMASAALGYGSGWLCGCSAAVIAVMCVAAVLLPDHRVNLFLIGEVRLKWVATVCCLLTFLGGGGNQAAHIGGLLWGLAAGLMLRKGIDPAAWMSGIGPNGPDSRSRRDHGRKPDTMVRMLRQRQADMQRLDELLDKIKLSGYDSLSRKERRELNELSQRLNKKST